MLWEILPIREIISVLVFKCVRILCTRMWLFARVSLVYEIDQTLYRESVALH